MHLPCTECRALHKTKNDQPTCRRYAPRPQCVPRVESDHWVDWPILRDLDGCCDALPKQAVEK